jgi:RHS repeat-associated protein
MEAKAQVWPRLGTGRRTVVMQIRSLFVPLVVAPLPLLVFLGTPAESPGLSRLDLLLVDRGRVVAVDPETLELVERPEARAALHGLSKSVRVAGLDGDQWLGRGDSLELVGASGQVLATVVANATVVALAPDPRSSVLWSVEGAALVQRDLVTGNEIDRRDLPSEPIPALTRLAITAGSGPGWLVDSGRVLLFKPLDEAQALPGLADVTDIEVDGYGAAWALAGGDLVRLLSDGSWFPLPLPADLGTGRWHDLAVRSDVVWMTDGARVVRLDMNRGTSTVRSDFGPIDQIRLSIEDSSPPRLRWQVPDATPSAGGEVRIVFQIDEFGAGVARSGLTLLVNGQPVDAGCVVGRQDEIACRIGAAFVRHQMAIEAWVADRAGNASNRLQRKWTERFSSAPLEQTVETTLEVTADTDLRLVQATTNYGADETMSVRWAGLDRPLVRFDVNAVAEDVEELEAAWLELYVVENGDNWGPGRLVEAHRMISSWAELGASWLCDDDSNPGDPLPNCWPWWWGGDFVFSPSDSVLHTDGLSGWVTFDVTADVQAFLDGAAANHGWLLKRWIDGLGWVRYATREYSGGYAPRLRLLYEPVEPVDETPPLAAFTGPLDGVYLADNRPGLEIDTFDDGSGVDTDSLVVAVNGAAVAATCSSTPEHSTCELSTPLSEGPSVLTATVADQAGTVSAPAQVTVHVDTIAPAPVDLLRTSADVPEEGLSAIVGRPDAAEAFTIVTVTNQLTGASGSSTVAEDGSFTLAVPAEAGEVVALVLTDTVGNSSAEALLLVAVPGSCNSPPDPAWIAGSEPLFNYDVYEDNRFLWENEPPVQQGVESGAIKADSVAVIRGRVLDSAGEPLPAVSISELDGPQFGCTSTRLDGRFDFALRADSVVLRFEREGYLPVQRRLELVYQQQVELDDVALIPRPQPTGSVILGTPEVQVTRGAVETDADGTRQATLLVPEGATSELEMPDGSMEPVTDLTLRIKEYTVGPIGPAAMPGTLPSASGYTYAVEITADEAEAAGATSIVFDPPILHYVENFLGFPIGTPVPAGFYDSTEGTWIAAADGRVVEILSIDSGGLAELDVEGSGSPADVGTLEALGFTDGERRELAESYSVGQELWRSPMAHLSTWDFNGAFGLPFGAIAPDPVTEESGTEDCNEEESGSVIECQSQVLRESIPITGTPFGLHYSSERTRGRLVGRSIDIRLTPDTVPDSILFVVLEIEVVGRHYRYEFPSIPSQRFTFVWDGYDVHGRQVVGDVPAHGRVGFVYQPVYLGGSSSGDQNFGVPGSASFTIGPARQPFTVWKDFAAILKALDFGQAGGTLGLGLPGWSITPQHVHSPHARQTGSLYIGDGTSFRSRLLGVSDHQLVGRSADVWAWQDGEWVLRNRGFSGVEGIAVDADGNIYFTSGFVFKRTPNGEIYQIAGGGPSIEDGVLAVESGLARPQRLDLGPDGSLYIAEVGRDRVRRILPDGTIETVVALAADPLDVSIGPDGLLYVATGLIPGVGHTIQRVDIETGSTAVFAGGNPSACEITGRGDGGMGPDACLILNRSATHIDWMPDGSLLVPEGWSGYSSKLRLVSPFGQISTFLGDGIPGNPIYGAHYSNSRLQYPARVAVDPGSGFIAIADGSLTLGGGRLSLIEEDGIINQGFAPSVKDMVFGPDGRLYWVSDPLGSDSSQYIRDFDRYDDADGEFQVASPDGAQLFTFSPRGRHQLTVDSHTGDLVYRFVYDGEDDLIAIEDRYGQEVTIQRDGAGRPVSITSPFGHVTSLSVGSDGLLTAVTDPAGGTFEMTYAEGALLTSFEDPRGHASTFTYDELGRLLSDTDAKGGAKTLARSPGLEDYTVALSSAGGAMTVFKVHHNPVGSQDRTRTDPGGIATTTLLKKNLGRFETSPDGTEVDLELGDDPRFGAQAVVPERLVIATPGGLSKLATTERTVTLVSPNASPQDPENLKELTQVLTVNGKVFTTTFTAATRTWRSTSAEGRTVETVLDAHGEVESIQRSGLEPVHLTRDSIGRLIESRMGSGEEERVATLGYAASGWLDSTVDAESRVFGWQYDPAGRPTTTEYPDDRVLETSFDLNGNMTALSPPGRPTHTFAYDEVDQQTAYQPPGGSAETYSYSLDRQPVTLHRPSGETIEFIYDGTQRVTLLDTARDDLSFEYVPGAHQLQFVSHWPDGYGNGVPETLAYSYDGFLPTATAWSGQITGVVAHTYDNDLRVVGQSVNGGADVSFGYDDDSLLTRAGPLVIVRSSEAGWIDTTSLGEVETSQTHNGFGEVETFEATVAGTPVFTTTYDRDRLGRISRRTETIGGGTSVFDYTYDQSGRLIRAERNAVLLGAYTYDANDNRLSYDGAFGPTAASYDDQDRLETYGGVDYTFDADGDLIARTEDGVQATYTYDAMGSLRQVVLPTGITIEYTVDGRNRRIGESVNGVLVHGYLYQDQLNPVAELDGDGNILSRFVYGTRSNVPDYIQMDGSTYRVIADHLGSVRMVIDTSTGAIAQRIDYDSFGRVLYDSNPGFQPFGYAGGLYEPQTGLVRFGTRDYEPRTGRWTAKDAIGFRGGETNLYAYGLQDPVNRVDPAGELSIPILGWTDFGEAAGQRALLWYADVIVSPDTAWYARPGAWVGATFSALWTPCTSNQTSLTLLVAAGLGRWSARPFWQYYPAEDVAYGTPWLARGWGWKPPYSTGSEAAEALSLPFRNPGTAVRLVQPSMLQPVAGPRLVAPENGMPGGGFEYFPGGFPHD